MPIESEEMFEVPGWRLRELTDERVAATARAERAEAAEADLRATVERVRATWRYIADTMATSSRDWSETATDAWLYGAIVGWGDGPDDPDEAWTAMAAVWWDADDVAQLKEIHATLAALDAQRPAEPPRAGRFEALLAAEHEQFDQRGELLKSITEYKDAPSGTVSAPPPSPEGEGARWVAVSAADLRLALDEQNGHAHSRPGIWDPDNGPDRANKPCHSCAARERLRAALDGGQPDTPAPEAEPAIDIYGRPCTVYMAPEGCTDPYRCRVHRGAYPAPAPTEETRNA